MARYNRRFRLWRVIQPDRLRRRLDDRELSQAELARRVGVSQASINKLAVGRSYSSRHLHLIARELGTTAAYLTGEADDPQADAPPPPEFSKDEQLMIGKWRLLSREDRTAIERILDRMISPGTVHAPKVVYRHQETDQ